MMITKDTPLPEMCQWLMPDTAGYLDQQNSEIQMSTLIALRNWMCKREVDLEAVDIFDLSGMVDQFVRSFVKVYKETQ